MSKFFKRMVKCGSRKSSGRARRDNMDTVVPPSITREAHQDESPAPSYAFAMLSDRAKSDMKSVLLKHRALQMTTDNFVFDCGREKELICINGTIPVLFKGKMYNIPVELWLLESYPSVAPMVFVKPTSEMRIQVSQHFDSNGRVNVPFFTHWSPVDSDLINLLEVTKIIFSEHPPVVWAGGFSDDIDDLPRILDLIKISAHLERAYDEMGLDKSATDEQIRSRFRQLVHIYHPDRGGSNEQFIRLQYCFASLLEARRRDFN